MKCSESKLKYLVYVKSAPSAEGVSKLQLFANIINPHSIGGRSGFGSEIRLIYLANLQRSALSASLHVGALPGPMGVLLYIGRQDVSAPE